MRGLLVAAMAMTMAWPLGSTKQAETALDLIVVVDVTASRHRCPEGVAGLPSSALSSSGLSLSTSGRRNIPPAVEWFALKGLTSVDTVRVGAMAAKLRLSQPVAGTAPELTRSWQSVFALPPVEWLGPSPLWDQLFDLIALLSAEAGRLGIIVVTDGLATGDIHTPAEVATEARKRGVRITFVAEQAILQAVPLKTVAEATGRDPHDSLRLIADESGGRFLLARPVIVAGAPCFERNSTAPVSEAIAKMRERSASIEPYPRKER